MDVKTIRQLLRQPIKTIFGVILVATAVAVLCVCLGQSFAAKETEQRLNETYMTAAFAMSDKESLQSSWLNDYAAEHPEVVKRVSHAGLASAYIPELTADNWTQHWHVPLASNSNMCAPYDTAILEITLTEIGECMEFQTYAKDWAGNYITDENGELMPLEYPGENVVVNLTGTVERAIALEEGYPDPTGFTARLTLSMPNQASLDELNLTVGERYLVYGTDYADEDWRLRHSVAGIMTWNKDTELPEWDLDTFTWLNSGVAYNWTEEQMDTLIYDDLDKYWVYTTDVLLFDPMNAVNLYLGLDDTPTYATKFFVDGFKCKIGDFYHGMSISEYGQFRSISMTLNDDGKMPKSRIYQTEDGVWVCEVIEEHCYINESDQEVFVSQDEYAQQYQEPTIVHLTGTAEEFLASEEGALWEEALHNVEVNNHAFAVIGVDKLRYIENFNSGEARIIQGRDFTNEELASGAKVCVISKQLAEVNGLAVGDTISPRFYDPDQSLEYQISMSDNTFTPKPLYYFHNTTQLQEAQAYTIVGIYEQNDPTPIFMDNYGNLVNPYGFTSNTIFVPKSATDAEMQFGETWLFKTVVLHNGALEDFQLAAIEAGVGEYFNYDDGGYSAVQTSLETYQKNSRQASVIGGAVYGILILLFLVLFPGSQHMVLSIMEALGAGNVRKVIYLLGGSLGVLLPGTAVGTVCGAILMHKVTEILTENAGGVLGICLNYSGLLMIAVCQLVVCLLLVLALAILFTRSKGPKKRK